MNPDDLMELLREARQLRMEGVPQADIDSAIAAETNGSIADYKALARMAFAPPAEEAALARVAGRSPVSQFGRAFTQGLTFGFADELAGLGAAAIPGGRGYTEARDLSRQRISDIRETAPGAALASEIAGGLAVPLGALGATRGAVASGVTRGARALRAGIAGAGVGGATGLLSGLGEGQGSLGSQLRSAAVTGGLGAGAGGLLGAAVGALTPTAAVTGQQVADKLSERVGRLPGTVGATDALDRSLQGVSRTMFKPLEKEFTEVATPAVQAAIRSEDRLVNSVIRRSLPEAVRAGERAPSFRELQSLLQRLEGKAAAARRAGDPAERALFTEAAATLQSALESDVPGFAEARGQWALLQASKRAIGQGERLYNARPETIERTLARLPDDAAREHFRLGMLTRWHDRLSQSAQMSRRSLERLRAAGISNRLRLLFADDVNGERAFRAFMDDIEHAGRAAADTRNLVSGRELTRSILAGLGVGGGAAGVAQLFGGR